ncbi:MAG TPA: hypothetical protein VKD72_31355 [Gemmataceae bacterium]|nr:hypothetical protein [Gemmataceae bacterium]
MRGRKRAFTVHLFPREQQELEHWRRSPTLRQGLARRGRLLLLLHQGQSLTAAARTVGFTVRNARNWAKR